MRFVYGCWPKWWKGCSVLHMKNHDNQGKSLLMVRWVTCPTQEIGRRIHGTTAYFSSFLSLERSRRIFMWNPLPNTRGKKKRLRNSQTWINQGHRMFDQLKCLLWWSDWLTMWMREEWGITLIKLLTSSPTAFLFGSWGSTGLKHDFKEWTGLKAGWNAGRNQGLASGLS